MYYLSVKYIPVSVAIVLLMQFTWFNLSFEWLFFRKRSLLSEGIITVVILGDSVLASGLLPQGLFLLSLRSVVIVLCASLFTLSSTAVPTKQLHGFGASTRSGIDGTFLAQRTHQFLAINGDIALMRGSLIALNRVIRPNQ